MWEFGVIYVSDLGGVKCIAQSQTKIGTPPYALHRRTERSYKPDHI